LKTVCLFLSFPFILAFFYEYKDSWSAKKVQHFSHKIGLLKNFHNVSQHHPIPDKLITFQKIKSRGDEAITGVSILVKEETAHWTDPIYEVGLATFLLFECNRFSEIWDDASSFVQLHILTPFKLLFGDDESRTLTKYIVIKVDRDALSDCDFKNWTDNSTITNSEKMKRRLSMWTKWLYREIYEKIDEAVGPTDDPEHTRTTNPLFSCGPGMVIIHDLEIPITIIKAILIN
jgi:hypothetical protein